MYMMRNLVLKIKSEKCINKYDWKVKNISSYIDRSHCVNIGFRIEFTWHLDNTVVLTHLREIVSCLICECVS